ncbi:MAG TPA: trypsin-like peptidase domain-containing protein [Streptosporangiaceae bacterium]
MAQITGAQAQRLSEALRTAFGPDALDEFLFYMLDLRREDLTLADAYTTRAFQLIRRLDSEGRIGDLVAAARKARPRNAEIQRLAAELGLSSAPPNLERIISDAVPFVDVSGWRSRLGELEGQVGRVEVNGNLSIGTGFLVGPDLCLTNYHVIEPLLNQRASPADTRLRLDYRRTADGTTVDQGTLFELADDWLAGSSPPDELDFALLRLSEAAGLAPAGRAGQLAQAPERGWIDQVGVDGFEPGSPLFLLTHPAGIPLKLAFGPSNGLNDNGTRLLHQVNTMLGSSGSPCFNARLELVGLHHAGEAAVKPTGNVAIPVRAITDYLAADPAAPPVLPRRT